MLFLLLEVEVILRLDRFRYYIGSLVRVRQGFSITHRSEKVDCEFKKSEFATELIDIMRKLNLFYWGYSNVLRVIDFI